MALNVGDKAPDFKMEATGGKVLSLSDYKGKKLVLYFYPKDDTPGCTKEACGFKDNMESITSTGAEVLGVSPDDLKSHDKFIAKYDLNFNLASDPDHTVAEVYGAWGEKNMYGRKYMGIIRSTFLIDEEGKIKEAWYKVKVPGHVEKVMEAISN